MPGSFRNLFVHFALAVLREDDTSLAEAEELTGSFPEPFRVEKQAVGRIVEITYRPRETFRAGRNQAGH